MKKIPQAKKISTDVMQKSLLFLGESEFELISILTFPSGT
jgi:hypothetical protein